MTRLESLEEIAKRIWKDPVASKILGSLGYAALSALGGCLLWPLLQQNWVLSSVVCSLAVIESRLVWMTFRGPSLIVTAEPGARYYSRRTRKLAGIAAAVLPVLAPALCWAVVLETCRWDTHIVVFVANFETSPRSANYRVTRTVFEHLRNSLVDFPDVVPELVGRSVSWDRDPASVLTWCQRQRKAILIWGDFDTTKQKAVVTAHFQLLRGSKDPLQGSYERRSPLGDLDNFTIQDDLARHFAYGALLITGILRFERSDFDAAITRLTAAIKEAAGNNANPALFYRGRSYFETHQYGNAIADFSTVLDHEPAYPYALNNRGASFVAIGDFQAGYVDLTRAIADRPSDPMAYVNRGSALYKLRKFKEALDDFDHAIQLAPGDPLAYEGRGNVYDKIDEIGKALADYDTAVRLDKGNPKIYFNRAIALHSHGRDDEAIGDMGRVLVLGQSVAAYEYRGYLFLRTGRRAQAIGDYQSALRAARSDSERNEIEGRLRDLGEEPGKN